MKTIQGHCFKLLTRRLDLGAMIHDYVDVEYDHSLEKLGSITSYVTESGQIL